MIRSKLLNEIHKKFSKLELPYYNKKKVFYKENIASEWECISIDFCVPANSLKNIILFCEINNFSLAYNGKLEINLYEISKIRKILGVAEDDLL